MTPLTSTYKPRIRLNSGMFGPLLLNRASLTFFFNKMPRRVPVVPHGKPIAAGALPFTSGGSYIQAVQQRRLYQDGSKLRLAESAPRCAARLDDSNAYGRH